MQAIRVGVFGECMVELTGTAFGLMRQGFGGDTLNTAVYLARSLGADQPFEVEYVTALGDDRFSARLVERWHDERLHTSLVRLLPGRMPGLYIIEVDELGERSFHYWRSESAARAYFDAPTTPLEQSATGLALLHFSAISLAILDPAGRERLYAVLRAVRDHGGRVSFDSNYRPRLWQSTTEAAEAFDRAYTLTDIALIGLDDELGLRGRGDETATIERLMGLPCAEVVIKRGERPAVLRMPDKVYEVPVEPDATVVDSTAAGDAFAGAYLASRLSGGHAIAAMRSGHQLAARVIGHAGAIVPGSLGCRHIASNH